MRDRRPSYSQKELEDAEIIVFDQNIYVPLTLRSREINGYHFYLNHPGGSRLVNTIRKVFYWKGLLTQAAISVKTGNKCQHFKKRKTLYGYLPPKIIASLKMFNSVNINLLVPYSKSIRQHHTGDKTIKKYMSLTLMIMIYPTSGWF